MACCDYNQPHTVICIDNSQVAILACVVSNASGPDGRLVVEKSTALRLGWTDRKKKRHSDWIDLRIVGGIKPVQGTMALVDERDSHEVALPFESHVPIHDIGAVWDIFGTRDNLRDSTVWSGFRLNLI